MSENEQALADSMGKFARVVEDGHKVPDVEWTGGRILLSNRRLLLVTSEDKETIPLSSIRTITGRQDVNSAMAGVSGYVSVQADADVILLSPVDQESFEIELYRAVLGNEVILAKHPAVEGGVVKDTDWTKGRLAIDPDAVGLALGNGRFVEIEIDDVGVVEQHESTVRGDERPVIEVEHAEETTAVETHISGTPRHVEILSSLLRKGEQRNAADVDLSADELEVLMALYSGVSPFQIPEFVGMDVDRVEEVYDQLTEQGILEKVRTRRNVALKARGRSVAGEAMGEE